MLDVPSQGASLTLVGDAELWGDAADHDEIINSQPGKDRIDLVGFGSAAFEALAARLQATNAGVLIAVDANSDLLVRGVGLGQLSAADFILV